MVNDRQPKKLRLLNELLLLVLNETYREVLENMNTDAGV